MNIFLSSCVGPASESVYCAELGRLAGLCRTEDLKLVSAPEIADLILIVDIFEADLYAGLRRNRIWQKWPEKSFAYCEGDCPPTFLHGLHSSASKALSGSGRFQGCAYPVHQLCYPNPRPPAADLAATPKDLLFFFAGRSSHRVRRQLLAHNFNRADVFVEDTSSYNHFAGQTENHRARARRPYWEMASRSKYALCPRGAGTSTVRIFEMMEASIAPVIMADDWLPPLGPSWEEFALFVPESEISSIYETVKAHEGEFAHRGRLARQAWEQYFSPENYWSFVLRSIRRIQENQRYPELLYARSLSLLAVQEWGRQRRIRTSIRLKSGLKKCLQKVNADNLRYGAMLH
jgi:Exostosin family